jgi:hypothetical protein
MNLSNLVPVVARIFVFLIACCVSVLTSSAAGELDPRTEALIAQLPQVSEIGYGYSAMFSGSQFLPDTNSTEVQSLVLGSQRPANSATLEAIVKRGIVAVPSLLKHLDDSRETRIPPLKGMMWMSFPDEYDYNRRVRTNVPAGVNREDSEPPNQHNPTSHRITVGDLCFVALGQIVNRNFNATRYQPTGGMVINSPTYSPRLCAVARADFGGLTEKSHRELLIQDVLTPDFEDRRNGACRRIAFYYPDLLEPLVSRQLAVPVYDVFEVNDFVRNELYPNKSKEARQKIFDDFLHVNGGAFSDGIVLQLFEDLDLQEGDEQHRISPPLNGKYDSRSALVQLYGYTDSVKSTDKPYVTNWEASEEARFIDVLPHVKNPQIDAAIEGIFLKVNDDDYLAIACMKHLVGRGYDEQIRQYCKRRIPKSKNFSNQLQQIIVELDSRNSANIIPGPSQAGNLTNSPSTNRMPADLGLPR